MGFIAILLLVFQVILMFTGIVYFRFESLVIILTCIFVFDVIYLGVTRKLTHMYGIFKKWFQGEVIENESWNNLLVNIRKVLVINYLASFSLIIVLSIISILIRFIVLKFFRYYVSISFHYWVTLLQMVIVYNGIFMGPIYLLLERKIKE